MNLKDTISTKLSEANPGGSWHNVRLAMTKDANSSDVKKLEAVVKKISYDLWDEYDVNEVGSFVEFLVNETLTKIFVSWQKRS